MERGADILCSDKLGRHEAGSQRDVLILHPPYFRVLFMNLRQKRNLWRTEPTPESICMSKSRSSERGFGDVCGDIEIESLE